jgi:hypothetical protein
VFVLAEKQAVKSLEVCRGRGKEDHDPGKAARAMAVPDAVRLGKLSASRRVRFAVDSLRQQLHVLRRSTKEGIVCRDVCRASFTASRRRLQKSVG